MPSFVVDTSMAASHRGMPSRLNKDALLLLVASMSATLYFDSVPLSPSPTISPSTLSLSLSLSQHCVYLSPSPCPSLNNSLILETLRLSRDSRCLSSLSQCRAEHARTELSPESKQASRSSRAVWKAIWPELHELYSLSCTSYNSLTCVSLLAIA